MRASSQPCDLAIIIVSTNEAKWLRACLPTLQEHAGGATLDVVIVDNESTDGTRELVETEFPWARVITCPNRGFSHANNRGVMATDSRYVLYLNPDTEIVDGTFGEMVALMDARPEIGLLGAKQLDGDGELFPTIRRFPNVWRAVGEAVTLERWALRPGWIGEREIDMDVYERETECDWTSGSFMFARREALLSAGYLDERFFIYSEEVDLCLRIKRSGWKVVHTPEMTIIHHADKAGPSPRMAAQDSYSRIQYARKHFSAPHRAAYLTAVAARHAVRAVAAGDADGGRRRAAERAALVTLTRRATPPFGPPPATAIELSTVATTQEHR